MGLTVAKGDPVRNCKNVVPHAQKYRFKSIKISAASFRVWGIQKSNLGIAPMGGEYASHNSSWNSLAAQNRKPGLVTHIARVKLERRVRIPLAHVVLVLLVAAEHTALAQWLSQEPAQ